MVNRELLSSTVLQQGALDSLLRSVRPAVADRCRMVLLGRRPIPIADQFRLYTALRGQLDRVRYDVPTDPWRPVLVDPTEVTHYNAEVELPWGLGRVEPGRWDRDENRHPVRELPRYRGLVQRFEEGCDWEDTVYYEDLLARYGDADSLIPRGYDDFDSFWTNRREMHENLYRSMERDGYRPNAEVDHDPVDWGAFVHSLEPLVVVGRDGEILWNEGFGRLVVATILDVDEIPVYVLCRHERWQQKRERVYTTPAPALPSAFERYTDHSDVRDVVG